MRDLKAVGKKFVHVMYPKKSSALLRDCTYKRISQVVEGCSADRLCLRWRGSLGNRGSDAFVPCSFHSCGTLKSKREKSECSQSSLKVEYVADWK